RDAPHAARHVRQSAWRIDRRLRAGAGWVERWRRPARPRPVERALLRQRGVRAAAGWRGAALSGGEGRLVGVLRAELPRRHRPPARGAPASRALAGDRTSGALPLFVALAGDPGAP